MVGSVGIDIIEVKRVKKAIERWKEHFLNRIFTPEEISYCQKKNFPEFSFAGRFACKEAAMKALGTGLSSEVGWKDFEIIRGNTGKPGLSISKRIEEKFGKAKILISLSHSKEYAVAVAVLLSGNRRDPDGSGQT
jgi:holo-[acyl-carrier protein] synthase